MEHFVHPCLLNHHIRAWGLARMLHAMNSDKGRFPIYTPLPSAEEYPAMNQTHWEEYVQKKECNPYPIRSIIDSPPITWNDFIASQSRNHNVLPMQIDRHADQGAQTSAESMLEDYAFRLGVGASDLSTMCLFQYLMEYETIPPPNPLNACDDESAPMDFHHHHPQFVTKMQRHRKVSLSVKEAYRFIIEILGPIPEFPPRTQPSSNVWINIANKFGKFYLTAFHPTSLHSCHDNVNDPWGDFNDFVLFLSNSQSELQTSRGKALLVNPPPCCDMMRQTLHLIQQVMGLSGANISATIDLVLLQPQWSRTMLVDSYAQLPVLLQREVTKRLHNKTKPFSIKSQELEQLYGIRTSLDILLDNYDPMDSSLIMDNTFRMEQDNLIEAGAVYLQFSAHSNQEIESQVFIVLPDTHRSVIYVYIILVSGLDHELIYYFYDETQACKH